MTCRKAHASTYVTSAGEPNLLSYESSPGKLRRFCPKCGTHLVAERPEQPHVILRVAMLDDDPELRPMLHIWTSDDVPWLKDLPRYPEWPPVR